MIVENNLLLRKKVSIFPSQYHILCSNHQEIPFFLRSQVYSPIKKYQKEAQITHIFPSQYHILMLPKSHRPMKKGRKKLRFNNEAQNHLGDSIVHPPSTLELSTPPSTPPPQVENIQTLVFTKKINIENYMPG